MMKDTPIKVFIIEDEIPAQQLLQRWVGDVPELQLCGTFGDGFSALKAIQQNPPDLVFLDIELPRLSGLELVELLENPPAIIFTTAYHEYAIQAFELAAVDYLLKPFSFERFKQAVSKFLETQNQGIFNMGKHLDDLTKRLYKDQYRERIALKNGSDVDVVPVSEIIYIEAQADYVLIYTKNNKYLKLSSLNSFETLLNPIDFVRVHRSFIVNVYQISKIENYSKDSYQIVLLNGKIIKISRSGLVKLREILYL